MSRKRLLFLETKRSPACARGSKHNASTRQVCSSLAKSVCVSPQRASSQGGIGRLGRTFLLQDRLFHKQKFLQHPRESGGQTPRDDLQAGSLCSRWALVRSPLLHTRGEARAVCPKLPRDWRHRRVVEEPEAPSAYCFQCVFLRPRKADLH